MYTFVMIRIIIILLYSMNSRIIQCEWTDEPMNYSICRKKYIIAPCDSANALEGTIFYRNIILSATNGSGGGTGGNSIFFCFIISPLVFEINLANTIGSRYREVPLLITI